MYQGGLVARQEADQRNAAQEASAAAGAAAPPPATAEGLPPGVAAPPGPSLPSFYSEDTPASANEMWQRLHADPLFAIKQQARLASGVLLCGPARWAALWTRLACYALDLKVAFHHSFHSCGP